MNAELIKALRECANWIEAVAASSQYAHDELMALHYCDKLRDAADALEAAEHRIDELERNFEEVCNANGSLACERNKLLNDVRELEAQIPKEGEWIDANTRPRSAQFYCSVCHRTCYDIQPTRDKAWAKRCRYQFCPNCGARMKTVTDCHTLEEGER